MLLLVTIGDNTENTTFYDLSDTEDEGNLLIGQTADIDMKGVLTILYHSVLCARQKENPANVP